MLGGAQTLLALLKASLKFSSCSICNTHFSSKIHVLIIPCFDCMFCNVPPALPYNIAVIVIPVYQHPSCSFKTLCKGQGVRLFDCILLCL